MTDTELSRWIVEKVFKECWHEDSSWMPHIRNNKRQCEKCKEWYKVRSAVDFKFDNPNLCTPDGSAMLKAKAIELGVWEHFATVCLWNYCQRPETISKGYHNYLTAPRLFAEAFRAFWIERGK